MTQAAPKPYAMPVDPPPTSVPPRGPTRNVGGLKRYTVESPVLTTQIRSPASMTAVGRLRASITSRTKEPDVGSIRAIVPSPKTAHTPLGPVATAPSGERRLVSATSNVS